MLAGAPPVFFISTNSLPEYCTLEMATGPVLPMRLFLLSGTGRQLGQVGVLGGLAEGAVAVGLAGSAVGGCEPSPPGGPFGYFFFNWNVPSWLSSTLYGGLFSGWYSNTARSKYCTLYGLPFR